MQIALGFGTSLLLSMLCISLLHRAVKEKGVIEASGILHNIWLWRSHPRLRSLLSDIKQPTEVNLRTAGLIPVQLSAKDMGSEDMQQLGNPGYFDLDHHTLISGMNIYLGIIKDLPSDDFLQHPVGPNCCSPCASHSTCYSLLFFFAY